MKLWSSYASYFCFSFGWHLSISRSFFSWDHAPPNLKGSPGYGTIERRNGERRLRRHSAQPQSPKGFHVQALVALVRLPNYLMASCSLLRFVRLTSAQVATWISAAPVAPCLFICQRLPLCHAPLQRKSLHGPSQRQSLHVDSIHCQRLPLMLHFTRCSASRFTYLVSL